MHTRVAAIRTLAPCCSIRPAISRSISSNSRRSWNSTNPNSNSSRSQRHNFPRGRQLTQEEREAYAWSTYKPETSHINRPIIPGQVLDNNRRNITIADKPRVNPTRIDTIRNPDPELEAELRPFHRSLEQRIRGLSFTAMS
jgi:hypothetical protein